MRDGRLRAVSAEEFVAQVAGEGGRGRVVEDQGGGQGETGGRAQPVAEFDGGERVEAGLAERTVRLEGALAGVAEHHGGPLAHQVQQDAHPVSRRGVEEASDQRGRGHLGAPRGPGAGFEGFAGLGYAVQQRAGARSGEGRDEAVPVHVRDGHGGLAAGQRGMQCGDRGERRDRAYAAPPQVVTGGAVGHAAVRPGAPGDGQRGQSLGPALFGEGVEEGVRGAVGALAAVAPDTGHRGEEHEGVQVLAVPGQLVQMERRVRLGAQYAVEAFGCERVDQAVVQYARRVHHGVHGVPGEQFGEGVAVGGIARGDRDPSAQLLQFRGEFGGAGGLGSSAADQHQVLGPGTGEPAGHMPAQRARAAGHEHGAARRPGRVRRCRAPRRAHEASYRHTGGAHGDLVLVALVQQAGQARQRAGVRFGGQVDEAAPELRLFQGDDPAQAPEPCGGGVGQRVRRAGRHRAAGQAPQRGLDPGVAEGLDEQHEPVEGVRPRVRQYRCRCEQDAVGPLALGLGQGSGERVAVGVLGHGERYECHAEFREPRAHRLGPRGLLGDHVQPGPRRSGSDRVGERLPGDPVAPAVGDGPLAPLTSPRGQLGCDHVQFGGLQPQERSERCRVLALDGVPELGVRRLREASGRRPGYVEPVALALEGVGGQVDAPGVREEGTPVNCGTADMEFGEGRDDGPRFRAVAAQYGDGDDVVRTALRHATEDTTGTDLHERPDTQLVQSPHTVRETNRLAHVPNPVRGRVRLGQPPCEVRNDRNPRLVEGQPADDLAELLQHRIHQR
ncbi:hypothetical protein GCM10010422_01690 [Streptomyces graminearus]|uniref:Uncharacterized protein n=1 Tax=Streptomyces graminearus TaxID=284030 RepID=A0ABP5XQD3_9ACTN